MVLIFSRLTIITLLFLVKVSISHSQNIVQKEWEFVHNPPYYANYGYLTRFNDLEIFSPYIGIGLQPTKFSIALYAQTGINIFYKKFTWKLEYLNGIVPDLSLFDYKNLEYFGQNVFIYDFNNVRISSTTKVGNFLYASHSQNIHELKINAKTMLGIKEIISFDFQVYNNEFINISSMFNVGIDHIIDVNESSYYLKMKIPLTIDFLHSKLGFMLTAFYTDYISKDRNYIIGETFSGYDEGIDIFLKNENGFFNNFYDLYGSLDIIYRVYMRFLPSGYDRIYVAVGGSTGIAYRKENQNTDFLYMATAALGYELYDTIPFEIRFTLDMDGNFFFNISVVSPLSHRFDSNLD